MITIKSFLSLKKVACISDLDVGDVALLNDKIIIKYSDNDIRKIGYRESNTNVTYIYGIRVPLGDFPDESSINKNTSELTDDVIQRVLIKRYVSDNGIIRDEEFIDEDIPLIDGKPLEWYYDDGYFFNNAYDNLCPFNGMNSEYKQVVPTADQENYILFFNYQPLPIDIKFTSLPIFYKNKEKTIQKNDGFYDYYLISEVFFDDFYPVESHLMDNGQYADKIWIESDWNTHNLKPNPDSFNKSKFFGGDYITEAENKNRPTFVINQLVWFDYLYYIYMIKCASFKPLRKQSWDQFFEKTSIFIYKNKNGKYFTNDGEIQPDPDYPTQIPLSFSVSSTTLAKGQIQITLTIEQTNYITSVKKIILENLNYCLILHGTGNNTNSYGEFYCTVNTSGYSDLVFTQSTTTIHNNLIDVLNDSSFEVILIKTVPFFRWQTTFIDDGTSEHDLKYSDLFLNSFEENSIDGSFVFCIDNLMNIFPTFFDVGIYNYYYDNSINQYKFGTTAYPGLTNTDYEEISKVNLNNYRTYIDSGTHSSWLNESTNKYHNILENTSSFIPYFDGVFATTHYNGSVDAMNNSNCIFNFVNKNVKQVYIPETPLLTVNDLYYNNNIKFISRGNIGGSVSGRLDDDLDYDYNEVELFTCLYTVPAFYIDSGNFNANNQPTNFSWNNFTLYNKESIVYDNENILQNYNCIAKENNIKNNWHCVTRLMFFDNND